MSSVPPIADGLDPAVLEGLLAAVAKSRPDASLERVERAFNYARMAHQGQFRASGEPFITHPASVAHIVADLRLDEDSIIAALLHDVIEDNPTITGADILAAFGQEVLSLVEGVTKLGGKRKLPESEAGRRAAETARTAETLRKMLLAMAKDIRVMIIKLSDRLHNMRTLDALPEAKRFRIAQETLDIFAPLAARLGIWQIKWQLEDLAFKALHPEEYARIAAMIARSKEERDQDLNRAMTLLQARLIERNLGDSVLMGRSKHLYSIFNKVKGGVPFEEVYDLIALRVLVEKDPDCYMVLGIVHDMWLPMPGLFFDYIGSPKPNGYQSIHTKVLGPSGHPLEVQIRTKEMHEVAEFGVAAHWSYKEGRAKNDGSLDLAALRKQLLSWSSDHQTSGEFLRTLTTDLFSEQVYVFTPKHDVLDLPVGATPLDFAFRIHTDLGLKTVGARVNGALVPLNYTLQNGDVVQMLTRSNAHPNLDWLKMVKSQHARTKIRSFLRNRDKEENAARGREAVEKELKRQGIDPKMALSDENMAQVAQKLRNRLRPEEVFSRVGEGLTGVHAVVSRLRDLLALDPPKDPKTSQSRHAAYSSIVGGLDNVLHRRGKCCGPIPGDEVAGYVSRGRGIVVHRSVCPNLLNLADQEPERVVRMEWEADGQTNFPVALKIQAIDRDGLLHDLTSIFADQKASVVQAKIKTLPNHTAEISFTVAVRDLAHLREITGRIGQLQDVLSTMRTYGKSG
jgi:GTP diphosphokinase / guanosine-3',5'-bis(diphosphate) 3'-diphosphatase